MTASLRILLVDDHQLIREGIKISLQSCAGWEVCGEAETAEMALQLTRQLSPDLAIVDLTLRQGNGMDLVKQMQVVARPPKVLVCSMHDEKFYAERALKAGASGYLNKQRMGNKLIEAISRIMEGEVYLSDPFSGGVLSRLTTNRSWEESHRKLAQLTEREMEVFEALGKGLTVQQIAKDLDLSPKTVETYRERTKKKLNAQSANELVCFAVRWVTDQNNG